MHYRPIIRRRVVGCRHRLPAHGAAGVDGGGVLHVPPRGGHECRHAVRHRRGQRRLPQGAGDACRGTASHRAAAGDDSAQSGQLLEVRTEEVLGAVALTIGSVPRRTVF